MTRAKFLNDLYRRLSVLTPEQAEQHLTYYAEMLADRMEEGMSEAEAVASMEPLDVIAQRILQDEGVPESPPQPPKYPDLPKTDGSRFTKAPDMSRKGIGKRAALVLLWVVAIAMAISAVGRWRTRHLSSDASETTAVDYGVAEDYAGDWEEYAEEWAEYAEAEWGEALYSDLADLWSIDVTPDGVFGSSFSLTPGLIFLQDGVHAAQLDADGADLGSARALDWVSLLPEGRYRYEDDIYRLDVGEAQSVNVKWNTGAVQIQGWDEEYIQFQEFSDTKLKQSQKLEYSVDGDMLNISKGAGLDKGLTVWVPTRLLDYLCVETSTADIYCGQLTADQGIVQATSGKIFVTNAAFSTLSVSASSGSADLGCVAAETIGVDTTSGGVNAAAVEGLRLDTSSGAVTATLPGDVPTPYVGVDTTSGDVALRLPEEAGFALRFDSSSGYFERGPFSVVRSGDMYVTGSGAHSLMLEVDTTSGSLRLGTL